MSQRTWSIVAPRFKAADLNRQVRATRLPTHSFFSLKSRSRAATPDRSPALKGQVNLTRRVVTAGLERCLEKRPSAKSVLRLAHAGGWLGCKHSRRLSVQHSCLLTFSSIHGDALFFRMAGQFSTRVMVSEEASGLGMANKKRWPSADTS